jgi:hypothetical protein
MFNDLGSASRQQKRRSDMKARFRSHARIDALVLEKSKLNRGNDSDNLNLKL